MDLVKKISTEIGNEKIGTKIGTAGKKLELKQKLKRKKGGK